MYVDVYISIDVHSTILRQSKVNVVTNKLFYSLNIAILVATLRTTCALNCATNTPQNAPRHAKKVEKCMRTIAVCKHQIFAQNTTIYKSHLQSTQK